MKSRYSIASSILIFALLVQGCGGNSFATNLRVILQSSGPLIQSLPIADKLKSGLIVDFQDLGNGAAILADELKACQGKACKLDAVNRFQRLFWDVQRRGHFGQHPKLEQIEAILKGIIDSARIFFGAPNTQRREIASPQEAEKELRNQIKQLEKAMQTKPV